MVNSFQTLFLTLSILFQFLIVPASQAADKVVVIPLLGGSKSVRNVVTVGKANATFNDPVAAINSISDASVNNPYLLIIGPGIYPLTQTLVMKPYVDIIGSGMNVCTLTGAISSGGIAASSAIISGADNASLAELSVANSGAGNSSIAIYNSNTSPHISNVKATAVNGTTNNYGIYNISSSPILHSIWASGGGGTNCFGISNTGSHPTMTDITAVASEGTNNFGIFNYLSSPSMNNVTATATGGTATNFAIFNRENSAPQMNDIRATATGGTDAIAINNEDSSPILVNVTASASSASSQNRAIYITTTTETAATPGLTNIKATADGGESAAGIDIINSSPTLSHVSTTASGASQGNFGLVGNNSFLILTDVIASAKDGLNATGVQLENNSGANMTNVSAGGTDGSSSNYGVVLTFSAVATIRRCSLNGGTAGLYVTDFTAGGLPSAATVSQSTIIGASTGAGSKTCVACDNGYGTALASTCL